MLTIGYVRVSTDRQAEQRVSLEAQEAKIRAMATVQGAELRRNRRRWRVRQEPRRAGTAKAHGIGKRGQGAGSHRRQAGPVDT